jgi:hypothetical protein
MYGVLRRLRAKMIFTMTNGLLRRTTPTRMTIQYGATMFFNRMDRGAFSAALRAGIVFSCDPTDAACLWMCAL